MPADASSGRISIVARRGLGPSPPGLGLVVDRTQLARHRGLEPVDLVHDLVGQHHLDAVDEVLGLNDHDAESEVAKDVAGDAVRRELGQAEGAARPGRPDVEDLGSAPHLDGGGGEWLSVRRNDPTTERLGPEPGGEDQPERHRPERDPAHASGSRGTRQTRFHGPGRSATIGRAQALPSRGLERPHVTRYPDPGLIRQRRPFVSDPPSW